MYEQNGELGVFLTMAPSAIKEYQTSPTLKETGKDGKEITPLEAISHGDVLPGN